MELRFFIHLSLFLELAGIFLFCKGFFPSKKAVLPGFAEDESSDVSSPFDRLVFLVIDALRSDFVFGPESSMSKVHDYINNGTIIAFTARAATPTVTLPRLKCLTTGSIPGFLDAVLNVAGSDDNSDVSTQDSWLQQMVLAGRRIHMYGDDTWIRLFPKVFSAVDGTSSFFVSDFTEVDNNVTRHLDHELSSPMWDTLILHYLGLDHIGHLDGPTSRHMPTKQAEMDGIIERIYKKSIGNDHRQNKSTLMIILGDHGMTGDGNHGGASEAETQTAMMLLSPLFNRSGRTPISWSRDVVKSSNDFNFYDRILQSDVVPALSVLLGLPIPINSLGIIPESVLTIWENDSDRLSVLSQNARQLQRLLSAGSVPPIQVQTRLPCSRTYSGTVCTLTEVDFSLSSLKQSALRPQSLVTELYSLMREIQDTLMLASSDYNMTLMYQGFGFLLLSLSIILWQMYQLADTAVYKVALIVPILHSITAFASSFVEEEQVFWYYATTIGLLGVSTNQVLKEAKSAWSWFWNTSAHLVLFRLLRRYNQTGQKYAGASDLSSLLLQTFPLWSTVSLLLGIGTSMVRDQRTGFILRDDMLIILVSVLLTLVKLPPPKYTFSHENFVIRSILLYIGILMVRAYFTPYKKHSREYYMAAVSYLFVLQSKPQNAVILLLFRLIDSTLQHESNIPWTIATYLALGQSSFFALGNSNSLSGLDLSQAYNGVSTYNEVLVGSLLFISAFIGPIFWQVALMTWIRDHHQEAKAKEYARTYLALCSCMYATALCVSCYTLRHHLFVFSVFSPKLLFTAAWSIFYGMAILIL